MAKKIVTKRNCAEKWCLHKAEYRAYCLYHFAKTHPIDEWPTIGKKIESPTPIFIYQKLWIENPNYIPGSEDQETKYRGRWVDKIKDPMAVAGR